MDNRAVLALLLRGYLRQLSELEVRQVHRLLWWLVVRWQDGECLLPEPQVLPMQDQELHLHPLYEDV
jgi:hypothetical protein